MGEGAGTWDMGRVTGGKFRVNTGHKSRVTYYGLKIQVPPDPEFSHRLSIEGHGVIHVLPFGIFLFICVKTRVICGRVLFFRPEWA